MNDFTSGFWNWYIALVTILSIAGCAVLLLLGGAAGWLAGAIWPGVTLVALAEIVVLLSLFRHKSGPMLQLPATPHPEYDRLMTRTRRIASRLRDLRSAAGTLPDAVVRKLEQTLTGLTYNGQPLLEGK